MKIKKNIYKSYRLFIGLLNFTYSKKLSSRSPIIICGCGRSGTTLLLSILSAHRAIHAIDYETGLLTKENLKKNPRWKTILLLSSSMRKNRKSTAVRWAEKTPNNINSVEEINEFFLGDVQFVNIVRDVRDVILSKHPTKEDDYWVEPSRWINDVAESLKFIDYDNFFTVRYEDLVYDNENTLRKLFKFLNLDFDTRLLEYDKHTQVKENIAWFDKAKRVNSQSVAKWKKSENYQRVAILQSPEYKSKIKKLMTYYKYDY